MYENGINDLIFYCVHRIALLDRFAELALWAALLFGTISAGLAAWKSFREIEPKRSEGDRNRALPGGLDTLIAAIAAAPAWIGLFGAGIALAYTATGFSERICLIQPAVTSPPTAAAK